MDNNDSEDLTKLDDPAPEHKRQKWNKETGRNHYMKPETNNSEDIYAYYAIFDNDISVTPPYSDVEACYKNQGSQYRQKFLLYHPDNNQDKTSEEMLTLLKIIVKHKKLWKK